MLLHRGGEDADRLGHVPLRPGELEEVPAPDDLRPAVEEVLVDPQRGLDAIAELAFQPLAQRGEDADALGVEADPGAAEVLAADVVGLRRY